MLAHLRPAVVMIALYTVFTGLAYPLVITGFAQALLPALANGSLARKGVTIVGSTLIGQPFTSDRYFHGRPSATSAPDPKDDSKTIDAPYNAANSSGSNLGPLSKKLIDRVEVDVTDLRKSTGNVAVPADAATTSASGLDPHISPEFAALQVARVAAARGVSPDLVSQILRRHIEGALFALVGERRVNVLRLNLDLDVALAVQGG